MVEKISNGGAKFFPAGWHVAAKPCDTCKSAPALLFCGNHTAFLCISCDLKLHSHTKHERVWLCDVCEHAPAVVTCKADAAALCVTCDRNIHSANPLASRHERIPVVTFNDSAQAVVTSSSADNLLEQVSSYGNTELITSSAGMAIPTTDTTNINVSFPSNTSTVDVKSLDLFSVADPFFDFGFAMPTELATQFHDPLNDCVVQIPAAQIIDNKSIDFTRCVTNSYNRSSTQSYSRSVSYSSMEVGVVPEENLIIDKSNPYMLPVNTGGLYCSQKAKKFCPIDRQARVLRYREKRKNRKFEKKIRYASRKAYAEMRPRINGRFVKRTESSTEMDVDRWLFTAEANSNSNYGAELEYRVVPCFESCNIVGVRNC